MHGLNAFLRSLRVEALSENKASIYIAKESAKALKNKDHKVMGDNNTMQEAHSMSWPPDKDNQQTILPGDSSFLPHREMDGLLPDYSNCFFESVKQEDQKRSIPGEQVEQLEQQGDGCLGFQQIGEEYSYPTPFGTTLGMEKDHEKKIKTGMEWNNLQQQQQQQQDPSSMFDPTASSSVCFQIPPDQPMFATDLHYHQNWVSGSMFGQTSYNQVCVFHTLHWNYLWLYDPPKLMSLYLW
ncbi:unnamed protein product [Brassica napus]|uniref:(rape) hypothetical protein n=1 Tax=Brassica napus TaxID=3708 RepID=A0A816L637_BRANA|nr:unnamed protein product [Brassica napus]